MHRIGFTWCHWKNTKFENNTYRKYILFNVIKSTKVLNIPFKLILSKPEISTLHMWLCMYYINNERKENIKRKRNNIGLNNSSSHQF